MIKVNGLLISFFIVLIILLDDPSTFVVHFIKCHLYFFSQMCNYIAIVCANIVDTFHCYHIHIYFLLNLYQNL